MWAQEAQTGLQYVQTVICPAAQPTAPAPVLAPWTGPGPALMQVRV